MEPRISVVTLAVTDLQSSRRFYEDGFRWICAWANEDVAFYQLGGLVLALFRDTAFAAEAGLPAPLPPGAVSLAHNVRAREEVDALVAEALSAGATLTRPASEPPWGGYIAAIADPEGHLWEIAWNPSWPIAPDGTVRFQP